MKFKKMLKVAWGAQQIFWGPKRQEKGPCARKDANGNTDSY